MVEKEKVALHALALTTFSFGMRVGVFVPGAGCSEVGFGSCVVSDAAVAGQCPYSLLLTGLSDGEVRAQLNVTNSEQTCRSFASSAELR